MGSAPLGETELASVRTVNIVKRNFFRDSLQLMRLTDKAKQTLKGISDVAVVMGTTTNKDLLRDIGLLTPEGEQATPSDTLIAVKLETDTSLEGVIQSIERLLEEPTQTSGTQESGVSFSSVEEAFEALPDANLALVSVPGRYATDVAFKILERGVSVHLFSDHVSLEEETRLKRYAADKGLLVLGPGAGTSIISGKGIAFANNVKRGQLGVVAAAGTGLQEISVLVDRAGFGISQGLGVGGGDVKSEVGGIMSKVCIERLERDEETSVICFVSKPPSPEVSEELVNFMGTKGKPFVACLIGGSAVKNVPNNVYMVETLHKAAAKCLNLMGDSLTIATTRKKLESIWTSASFRLGEGQKYVRGLFTGGTLTYESLVITSEMLGEVWSNAPIDATHKLDDHRVSKHNTLIDMGEEEFTEGRAHPMMDPTLRKLRLLEEAKDPEVGVIMLDFVLGYGSHPDPAGAMSDAIIRANQQATKEGRQIVILGHVCGTEKDPQVLSSQEAKLRELGVILFPTNAEMALSAAVIARRDFLITDTARGADTHEKWKSLETPMKKFLGGTL
jgi:succinyl-CoA synthetase alpha subunit